MNVAVHLNVLMCHMSSTCRWCQYCYCHCCCISNIWCSCTHCLFSRRGRVMPVFICSVVSTASEGCLLPSMVSYAPVVFLRHEAEKASIAALSINKIQQHQMFQNKRHRSMDASTTGNFKGHLPQRSSFNKLRAIITVKDCFNELLAMTAVLSYCSGCNRQPLVTCDRSVPWMARAGT
jgi:hypothetical protein